ncbi:hypothetical protein EDB19DRAFT_1910439 [Suillus lakei]|nr:hypothetical protein EDB19DRAFT_1910439 [Suillus lakei]
MNLEVSKREIAVLDGHTEVVTSITLFPNDCLLASTSWDNTARLWNLDTNLPVGPPLQHEQDVECAAFSADGKLLSTACDDETPGLEDLLFIPNAQNFELKKKSLSSAKATRRPVPHRVPPGFFDDARDHGPSSTERGIHPDSSLHHRRTAFAPSWGSHPRALLARIPSLFRRSQPNHKPTELQQRPGSSTFSRRSPPVVEVPALDDKKALYTARRTKRASDKVKRVRNPAWWARVVLFICCASQSTGDTH